jgi:hypothetical protein
MASKSFTVTESRILFGATYVIYAGNDPADLGNPTYRTHGNLSLHTIAAIMRKIADAVDRDDTNVVLEVNGHWIIG